jgi:hypothetical protein
MRYDVLTIYSLFGHSHWGQYGVYFLEGKHASFKIVIPSCCHACQKDYLVEGLLLFRLRALVELKYWWHHGTTGKNPTPTFDKRHNRDLVDIEVVLYPSFLWKRAERGLSSSVMSETHLCNFWNQEPIVAFVVPISTQKDQERYSFRLFLTLLLERTSMAATTIRMQSSRLPLQMILGDTLCRTR